PEGFPRDAGRLGRRLPREGPGAGPPARRAEHEHERGGEGDGEVPGGGGEGEGHAFLSYIAGAPRSCWLSHSFDRRRHPGIRPRRTRRWETTSMPASCS